MVVQWWRLHTSTAGGIGSVPGWGTKIPHAMQPSQKKKEYTKIKLKKHLNDRTEKEKIEKSGLLAMAKEDINK